jgi:hypothetical protein
MTRRTFARLIVVAVAAAALSGVPLGVRALGEETDLGGYQMSASATAISFIYNQPSFGLPTDPTFELRKVHALSLSDSGPSGRALSSVVWPGDAAGNADPALILDLVMFDPTNDGTREDGGYLSPYIPQVRESMKAGITEQCSTRSCTYPVRAEAFYPEAEGHPSSSMYPAGGVVEMIANAREGRSDATTLTKEAGLTGAFFVGAMSARTWTEVRRGIAIAHAATHLEDVSLLGLVSFATIDTLAETTSDGKLAKPKTSVSVTGMSIDAQCQQPGANPDTCSVPIYVDREGLHAGRGPAQDPTGGQAQKLIDQYLKPQGFDVVVTPASQRVDKEAAEGFGSVNGLIIRMNSKGFNTLVDSIPNEDLQRWIRSPSAKDSPLKPLFNFFAPTVAGYATSFTQGDQTMSIVLGDASVDAAAAPLFTFEQPDFDVPPLDTGGGVLPPTDTFTGEPAAPPPAVTTPARPFVAGVPVAVAGLPGGIAALVALLGALAALMLRRFADAATKVVAVEACPLESSEDA